MLSFVGGIVIPSSMVSFRLVWYVQHACLELTAMQCLMIAFLAVSALIFCPLVVGMVCYRVMVVLVWCEFRTLAGHIFDLVGSFAFGMSRFRVVFILI